jgi:hypothetical protein
MTHILDTANLKMVQAHINVIVLQASEGGVIINMTGKTLTAKLRATPQAVPIAFAAGSGLEWVNAALGQLALTLSQVQVDSLTLGSSAAFYLTVWNADNSIYAHGSFPVVVTLG